MIYFGDCVLRYSNPQLDIFLQLLSRVGRYLVRTVHYEERYLPSLNLLVRLNSTNRECRAFSLPLHSLPSHLPLSTHWVALALPHQYLPTYQYHPSHLYLKAKVPTIHSYQLLHPSITLLLSSVTTFFLFIIIITYSSYFFNPRLAPRTSSTLTQTSLSQ
jgi:hypothetical protein